jgi:hypothetical protein
VEKLLLKNPNKSLPIKLKIEAWASMKSFRPQDTPPPEAGSGRNQEVGFHGEKRLNQTHASTTDPEASWRL